MHTLRQRSMLSAPGASDFHVIHDITVVVSQEETLVTS